MKPWSTIIIDDEKLARQRLKRLLAPYDEIDIIEEGENGQQGLALIQEHRPDLIFLDIEMPILNGFEMLAKLDVEVRVIFTTAYDQYAIKAFEEGSIDYLLKPIEAERLEKTIKKLNASQMYSQSLELEKLLQKLQPKKEIKTITVKIGDRILLVKVSDLTHIVAEEKYVFLHTQDQKKHLTDFTLSALEEKLPDHFVRINRSALINSEYIKEIRKGFNGSFVFILNDYQETRVTSSRSHSQGIRARFDL
jgi:two-component system LytT family response regulator